MGTLYRSGRIITMTSPEDAPDAVLVHDGIIAAVGDLEAVRAQMRPGDEEVDLAGRTLMPSFIDPHGHLMMHGTLAAHVDLEQARSIDELVGALSAAAAARETGDDAPLLGVKYDPAQLAEGRHPTRHDLDRAAPGTKVLAVHRSLHVAVASTALLQAAGIDASTPDPEGGRYGREADGTTPDGYLEEHAAMAPLAQALSADGDGLVPGLTTDASTAVRAAVDDYLRRGITTAQDGAADPRTVAGLVDVAASEGIGLDLVVYPLATSGQDAFAQFPQHAGDYRGGLRLGGSKLVLDGSPQARSAWMSEPYEPLEDDDADAEPFSGYPILTDAQVEEHVRAHARAGRQLIVHCNGDAAAEQWISAVERVAEDDPRVLQIRPVMIHAQTVRDDQLERMAPLGMIASIFSVHSWFWGDVHLRSFGPERGRRISPARSALDRGVRVTLHQDTPVTPPDMLLTLWAATNRRSRAGTPIGPEQAITTWEALRAVTAEAAYQYGEEASKGRIAPGMRADLVILSRDPLSVPVEELRDIEVLATIKDGETVHEAR